MNKIFKVVWSKVRNCYVVVSEVAKANSKSGVKSRVGRTSLAAAMAVAVMMSGSAYAAENVDFTGHSYTINDADGAQMVVINTTDTENYGVFGNSGTVTMGDVTINTASGGIKIAGEDGPTELTINAQNMTINSQKWSGLYTTSKNTTTNQAKPGSVLTVNVEDTLKFDSTGGSLAGSLEDRSIVVNANTIDAVSDTSSLIWGTGNTTLNAQDISIETGAYVAMSTDANTATIDINAEQDLAIIGSVSSQGGKISLEGKDSVTIKEKESSIIDGELNGTNAIDVNNAEALIEVTGGDINITGAVSSGAGKISLEGKDSVTIEGKGSEMLDGNLYGTSAINAHTTEAVIEVTGKDITIIGETCSNESHVAAIYSEGDVDVIGTGTTTVEGCIQTVDPVGTIDVESKELNITGAVQSSAGLSLLKGKNP